MGDEERRKKQKVRKSVRTRGYTKFFLPPFDRFILNYMKNKFY